MKYEYEVRQGNNLASTLFIIVIQLVAEYIINTLYKENVRILSMKCNNGREGVLKLHKGKEIENISNHSINMLICVNDRARVFESREYIIKGILITCKTIV